MKEFESFGEFASFLVKTAAMGEAVSEHALKQAATIIKEEAQDRIGSYQDAIGPYGAWANLAPSTIDDRIRKGFTPDDPLLRTGEMRASIEAVAHGSEAVVATPDVVALYQDQGTDRIPPRPFFGPAAIASREKVARSTGAILLAWLAGLPWRGRNLKLPGQ
jgi:hypothetical protein